LFDRTAVHHQSSENVELQEEQSGEAGQYQDQCLFPIKRISDLRNWPEKLKILKANKMIAEHQTKLPHVPGDCDPADLMTKNVRNTSLRE
jgi:hypothetical protein